MDRSEASALISKMETCTTRPNILTVEDFARLGVRPNEYRLNIIRCAASRHSRALAELQLRVPSQETANKLAQVATSAYRLLDPRNRQQRSQRIYVGRILPLTLQGAGQTQFLPELAKFGASDGEIDRSAFERKTLSNSELIRSLELESSPAVNRRVVPIRPRHFSKAILLRDARFRWMAMAVLVLTVGLGSRFSLQRSMWESSSSQTVASLKAWQRENAELGHAEGGHAEGGHAEVGQSSDSGLAAPKTPAAVAFSPIERHSQNDVLSSMNTTQSLGAGGSVKQNESVGPRTRELAQQTISPNAASEAPSNKRDTSSTEQSDSSIEGSGVWESDRRVTQNAVKEINGESSQRFLADPFGLRVDLETNLEMSAESPAADPNVEQKQQSTDAATTSGVHTDNQERSFHQEIVVDPAPIPLPNRPDLEVVRRELIELTPQIASSFEAETAHLRIEQLEWIERVYPIGSPERWVLRHWIAEAAWLVEPVDRVERRLAGVIRTHGLPIEPSLAETFVGAAAHASLPGTRKDVIDKGFCLADRFLVSSLPAQCQAVVAALQPFVYTAPTDDRTRKLLNDFSDAADLMSNQQTSVANLETSLHDLKPDQAVMLGRNYCLLQRRWGEGLVWLSGSFNRQIANAARHEMLLNDQASAEDLKKVAGLWLLAAEQNRGRAADSMRVHAIELLGRARAIASQLTLLEIDRLCDDTLSQLPRYLIPTQQDKAGAVDRPSPGRNRFSEGSSLF